MCQRQGILLASLCVILTSSLALAAQPLRTAGSYELRLRSEILGAPPEILIEHPQGRIQPLPSRLTLLDRRTRQDPAPRQRDPKPSPDNWVVQGVDGEGQVRYQHVMTNPHLLRAEFPDEHGHLHGETLEHPHAEFTVTLPRDPRLTEVRILQPVWDGATMHLELLDTVSLR